jgi:hypothetical protein
VLIRRKRAPPEVRGARRLPATPIDKAPQPAQALAVVLPQPPPQEALGDRVAALRRLADFPPAKLLTVEQVRTLIPIFLSTRRRGVRNGRFPPGALVH